MLAMKTLMMMLGTKKTEKPMRKYSAVCYNSLSLKENCFRYNLYFVLQSSEDETQNPTVMELSLKAEGAIKTISTVLFHVKVMCVSVQKLL